MGESEEQTRALGLAGLDLVLGQGHALELPNLSHDAEEALIHVQPTLGRRFHEVAPPPDDRCTPGRHS